MSSSNSGSGLHPQPTGNQSDSSRTVRFNDTVTEHNYTPQPRESQMDSDARIAEALQRVGLSSQGGPEGRGQTSDLLELIGPPGAGSIGIPGANSGPFPRTSYMATATRTQSSQGYMGGGVETMSTMFRSFGGYGHRREPGPDEEWYSYVSEFSGNTRWKIRKKTKPPELSVEQGGDAGGMSLGPDRGTLALGQPGGGIGGGESRYQDLFGQGPGMPQFMQGSGMDGFMGHGGGFQGFGDTSGMSGSVPLGRGMPAMTGSMVQGTGRGMLRAPMHGRDGIPGAGGSSGSEMAGDPFKQFIEAETIKAKSCTDSLAHGANTIIILDTSASMEGEPVKEASEAIERFLLGLEENAMEYCLEENVGLITFGSADQTCVVQHMTNDFSKIRDALGNVRTRGMSCLYLGLLYTLGLFERVNGINVYGHNVHPRVIILSDGNVTDGPDTGGDVCIDQNKLLQINNIVVDVAQKIAEQTNLKMYFIPVGKANEVLPDLLSGVTGGSVELAGDAKWLSRFYIHHMVVGMIYGQTKSYEHVDRSAVEAAAKSKFPHLEDRDIDAIMSLIEEEKRNHTGYGGGQGSHSSMQSTIHSKLGPDAGYPGTSPMKSGGPFPSQTDPNVGFPGTSPMKSGGPFPSQTGPNAGFPRTSPMNSGGPVPSQTGPNVGFPGTLPMNSGGLIQSQTGPNAGTLPMTSGGLVASQTGPNVKTSPMKSGGLIPSLTGPNAGFPGTSPMKSGEPVPSHTGPNAGFPDKLPVQTETTGKLSSFTAIKKSTTTPDTKVCPDVTSSKSESSQHRDTESEKSGSDLSYSQSESETDDGKHKGARPKRYKIKWNQLGAQSPVNQNLSKHEPNQELSQKSKQEPTKEPTSEPSMVSPQNVPNIELPNRNNLPQNHSNVGQNKGQGQSVSKHKHKWNVLKPSQSENTGQLFITGQNDSLQNGNRLNSTGPNNTWQNGTVPNYDGQNSAGPNNNGQNDTGLNRAVLNSHSNDQQNMQMGSQPVAGNSQIHGIHLSGQSDSHLRSQNWNQLNFGEDSPYGYQPNNQAGGGQQFNLLNFQQNTHGYQPSNLAGGNFGSQQQWTHLDLQQNTQHAYQPLGQFSGQNPDPLTNLFPDFETDLPPGANTAEQTYKHFAGGFDKEKLIDQGSEADGASKEIERIKRRRRRRKPKKGGNPYSQNLDITFDDISQQAVEAVGIGQPREPVSEDPETATIEQAESRAQGPPENNEQEPVPRRPVMKIEDLLRMQSGSVDVDGQKTLFPGMMGDGEIQQESSEITEDKIKEFLENYGTVLPKTDNLPKPPKLGLRVTTGPDWMWRHNGVEVNESGTVIFVDAMFEGWVRVRWDNGIEEDYRYGLDYEFDIQPLIGGMEAVEWPPGKERIISEPDWLEEIESDEFEDDEEEPSKGSSAQSEENSGEKMQHNNTSGDQASAPEIIGANPPVSAGASGNQSVRETCFVWQYKDDENNWRTYPVEIQEKLEKTYIKRKGKGSAVIQMDGKTERVVFKTVNGHMEQRNADKQTTRSVQRIEADAEKLRELQDMYSQS